MAIHLPRYRSQTRRTSILCHSQCQSQTRRTSIRYRSHTLMQLHTNLLCRVCFFRFVRTSRKPHIYCPLDQHSSTSHPSLMVLHPLLSRGPNLMFNVTRDLAHVQLRPDCSPNRLQESAVHPPVSHMIISIFELPAWSIEVMNPRGVTVSDVLLKVRELVNRNVASHEMHGPSHAVAIDSFRARSRADPRERAQGVKRVDFLGPKVFFAGLTRARDGSDSWDLHFSHRV
jgi:hypothetical protein